MDKKVFGLVAVFLVSAVVGYFVYDLVSPVAGGGSAKKTDVISAVKAPAAKVEEPRQEPELKLVEAPVYDEARKKYKFKVDVKGDLHLTDADSKEVKFDSKDGYCYVDPAPGGYYLAYAADTTGRKSSIVTIPDCKVMVVKVNKITKEEFQKIIDSRNVTTAGQQLKGRTVGAVQFSFSGISDAEKANTNLPKHISNVIDLLKLGIWNSATVQSMSYDEADRLKSVSISVSSNWTPDE